MAQEIQENTGNENDNIGNVENGNMKNVGSQDNGNVVVEMNEAGDGKRGFVVSRVGIKHRGRPRGTTNKVREEKLENNLREEENKQPEEGWEFDSVIPIIHNGEIIKFSCSVSISKIAKMYLSKNIIYNSNVQRGMKTNNKGQVVEIFQPKKVKEICIALKEDRWYGSVITLNANKDTGIEIVYDEETRTLSGNKPLDLLDGNHRVKSFVKIWKEYNKASKNSNIDPEQWEIPVIIENLSEADSCALFSEYSNTCLRVSRSRSSYLDVYTASNMIIRHLMKYSELHGKIDCINVGLRNEYIITFGTLSSAIDTYLKPKTAQEAENLKSYLVEFYDILINCFAKVMGNVTKEERKAIREESYVIEPIFMAAYINIFKNLIGLDDWKGKIEKLKDVVQVEGWTGNLLSRSNPYWEHNITRGNGKIVSTRFTSKFVADSLVNYIFNGVLTNKIEE